LGVDITRVQRVGEQDEISSAWGLVSLILCDGLGTIEVALDGDDGDGTCKDFQVLVGDKDGEVIIW